MFVKKSKPLTAGFGCAAAAMVMGLAAGPAQADSRNAYQQDSYCSAPEVCNQRQIGIIQKERDGVNYFYGGSAVAPPLVSYVYLRDDTIVQPVAQQPVLSSNLFAASFEAPLSKHGFRMKKDHWKWMKHQPSPLDIPGLDSLDIPGVDLGDKHTAP